jgi:hypothetical protein
VSLYRDNAVYPTLPTSDHWKELELTVSKMTRDEENRYLFGVWVPEKGEKAKPDVGRYPKKCCLGGRLEESCCKLDWCTGPATVITPESNEKEWLEEFNNPSVKQNRTLNSKRGLL